MKNGVVFARAKKYPKIYLKGSQPLRLSFFGRRDKFDYGKGEKYDYSA